MDTMNTRVVVAESLEEMPRRKHGEESEPVQETVPVTIRIPTWLLEDLEATAEREQRPLADVMKRLLSRAVKAGWTMTFEATSLTQGQGHE